MKNKIMKCSLVLMSAFLLQSCNRDDVKMEELSSKESLNEHVVSKYVDDSWSPTSYLVNYLPTTADTNFMSSQMSRIAALWGRYAPVLKYVKDDNNPQSTNNAISYDDGRIYYGYSIYQEAKSKSPDNIVNALILAHEYGHQLQYIYGLPTEQEYTARASELEADGYGGYYLRMPNGFNKTYFYQIAPAYESAFDFGDYNTSSAGHHGTPPQRRSAVRLGFLLANAGLQYNYRYSAVDFDYYFFYYYDGVLNGTYKGVQQALKAKINPDIAKYMDEYVDELKQIQTGKMSKEEYLRLE